MLLEVYVKNRTQGNFVVEISNRRAACISFAAIALWKFGKCFMDLDYLFPVVCQRIVREFSRYPSRIRDHAGVHDLQRDRTKSLGTTSVGLPNRTDRPTNDIAPCTNNHHTMGSPTNRLLHPLSCSIPSGVSPSTRDPIDIETRCTECEFHMLPSFWRLCASVWLRAHRN